MGTALFTGTTVDKNFQINPLGWYEEEDRWQVDYAPDFSLNYQERSLWGQPTPPRLLE